MDYEDLPSYCSTRITYQRLPTVATQTVVVDGVRVFSIDAPTDKGEPLWYDNLSLYQACDRSLRVSDPIKSYEGELLEHVGLDGFDHLYYFLNALAKDSEKQPSDRFLEITASRLRAITRRTREQEEL